MFFGKEKIKAKDVVRKYDPDDNTFGFIRAGSDAKLKTQCVKFCSSQVYFFKNTIIMFFSFSLSFNLRKVENSCSRGRFQTRAMTSLSVNLILANRKHMGSKWPRKKSIKNSLKKQKKHPFKTSDVEQIKLLPLWSYFPSVDRNQPVEITDRLVISWKWDFEVIKAASTLLPWHDHDADLPPTDARVSAGKTLYLQSLGRPETFTGAFYRATEESEHAFIPVDRVYCSWLLQCPPPPG